MQLLRGGVVFMESTENAEKTKIEVCPCGQFKGEGSCTWKKPKINSSFKNKIDLFISTGGSEEHSSTEDFIFEKEICTNCNFDYNPNASWDR